MPHSEKVLWRSLPRQKSADGTITSSTQILTTVTVETWVLTVNIRLNTWLSNFYDFMFAFCAHEALQDRLRSSAYLDKGCLSVGWAAALSGGVYLSDAVSAVDRPKMAATTSNQQ